MPRRLRCLVWNVYVGQHPAKVRAALLLLVARHWPHAIVLQEAKRFRGTIPGYRRHAANIGHPDAGNCIVLVRKGLPQSTARALPVVGGAWVHKRPKPARVFVAVKVAWLTVVSVHRCTRGPDNVNAPAWKAEHKTLLDAARVRDPLAMLGDWNAHPDARSPSPARLAEQFGGHVVTADESDIDYALVRGAVAVIKRGRATYGSPGHAPFLITFTKD